MKRFYGDYKTWIQVGMLYLVSGMPVMQMNPIPLGLFTVAYGTSGKCVLWAMTIIFGMIRNTSFLNIVKYSLSMIVVLIMNQLFSQKSIFSKKEGNLPVWLLAAMEGITVTALSASNALLGTGGNRTLLLAFLEGVLVFTSAILCKKGWKWIKEHEKGGVPDNEEMISLTILFSIAIGGIPVWSQLPYWRMIIEESSAWTILGHVSLTMILGYLFILIFGYCYGSGAGAIAGTAIGILLAIQQQPQMIGILCIGGIVAGTLSKLGRLGSMTAFFLSIALLQYIMLGKNNGSMAIRNLMPAVLLLGTLPSFLLSRNGNRTEGKEEIVLYQNYQAMLELKLDDFAGAFRRLSGTLKSDTDEEENHLQHQERQFCEEVENRICGNCPCHAGCDKNKYSYCGSKMLDLLEYVKENGWIGKEDLVELKEGLGMGSCIHMEEFVLEANARIRKIKEEIIWKKHQEEQRKILSDQMGEVAFIINDFAKDIRETKPMEMEQEKQILRELHQIGVKVKSMTLLERRGNKLEIQISLCANRKICRTTREVAAVIGTIIGKRMRSEESARNVIPKEYVTISFLEDTAFKCLTGMARIPKVGEKISGDNFSFLQLGIGELFMMLSDGMGSGEQAYEESETVVELMEHMLEAGFPEESAIRLVNSMLASREEQQTFSTVDICVVDLYTGMCQFLKNGAASTFIKRGDSVEWISGAGLPVGMVSDVETEKNHTKLYDGDIIIMVTDGVLDAFLTEQKEQYMEQLLEDLTIRNPQEIADYIMKQAMGQAGGRAGDDMSVMVAGIWES